MTSRQIVLDTLNFNNPERIPRQLWTLPWAENKYPEMMKKLNNDYPDDIVSCPEYLQKEPVTKGDQYKIGTYVDEWGCIFNQRVDGIIGEVKNPISLEEDFSDFNENVHIPTELLTVDKDKVNKFCKESDKFVLAGCFPRIFERMQFIRGTEQFYVDIMMQESGLFDVLDVVSSFFYEELEAWGQTDVDGLMIMDDWGAQSNLLINPVIWRQLFKPIYANFAKIARKYNKKIFMHSDGYIIDIYPELIEIGIDAVNSQIFCMGFDKLKQFAGKITFWGEMDRQDLLPNASLEQIDEAVSDIYKNLYKNGGCVAQCEFGLGANPENVYQMFNSWSKIKPNIQ